MHSSVTSPKQHGYETFQLHNFPREYTLRATYKERNIASVYLIKIVPHFRHFISSFPAFHITFISLTRVHYCKWKWEWLHSSFNEEAMIDSLEKSLRSIHSLLHLTIRRSSPSTNHYYATSSKRAVNRYISHRLCSAPIRFFSCRFPEIATNTAKLHCRPSQASHTISDALLQPHLQ